MKVLAIGRERPAVEWQRFEAELAAEARCVWGLYTSGNLREIYFTPDHDEAVLMLECSGADEARRILASLPLVQRGLVSFEVKELVPYTGLERLFNLQVPTSG